MAQTPALTVLSLVFAAAAAIVGQAAAGARSWLAWGVLFGALLASLNVAAVVIEEPARESYWRWFWLWAAAVAAPTAALAILERDRAWRLPRVRVPALAWAAVVGGVALVALAVRLWAIGDHPSPPSDDEAIFTIAGFQHGPSEVRNMFTSGIHGTPRLYFLLVAGWQATAGDSLTASRVLIAIFGSATVLLAYLMLSEAYGRRVALAGAAFLALFHYHLHYSRIAYPNITDPLFTALTLWLTQRAVRTGSALNYALAGLALGGAAYGWSTARILPAAIAVLLAVALIESRQWQSILRGAAVMVIVAVTVVAPIAAWWREHPQEFNTRSSIVYIFSDDPGPRGTWWGEQRDLGRSPGDILGDQFNNTRRTVFGGPELTHHYGATIGLVETLPALLLVVGAVAALFVRGRPLTAALATLGVGSFVMGGVLIEPAPSSARLIGTILPTAAGVGLGATYLAVLATRAQEVRTTVAATLVAGMVALPGLYYYFGDYRDSELFSNPATRLAKTWGTAIRAETREGDIVYWLGPTANDPRDSTLAYHLRDTSFFIVKTDGTLEPERKPLKGEYPRGRAFVAGAGDRLSQLQGIRDACPGPDVITPQPGVAAPEALVMYRLAADCPALTPRP